MTTVVDDLSVFPDGDSGLSFKSKVLRKLSLKVPFVLNGKKLNHRLETINTLSCISLPISVLRLMISDNRVLLIVLTSDLLMWFSK